MKTRSITAVVDLIIRPNICFANISNNTKFYFISSIIIFSIAGVSVLLSDAINMSYWNNDGKNYLGFSTVSLSLLVIHIMLRNFVMIAAIFWIGKKLGGSTSFKKIFSVLSYCLIPAIIGALVVPLALTFLSEILFTEVGGNMIDLDPDLSPSYALDLYLQPLFQMVLQ